MALRDRALELLIETDAAAKTAGVAALADACRAGAVRLDSAAVPSARDAAIPGRPARPELVPPRLVGGGGGGPGRRPAGAPAGGPGPRRGGGGGAPPARGG
ncbi:hypothetical protein ACCD01_21525, partial [Telluria sp. Tellsp99]